MPKRRLGIKYIYLTIEIFQALDRLENSRIGGIAHRDIYGHDEKVELELIGRAVHDAYRKAIGE